MNKYTIYANKGDIEYYVEADCIELRDNYVLFTDLDGDILAYFKREVIEAIIKKVNK